MSTYASSGQSEGGLHLQWNIASRNGKAIPIGRRSKSLFVIPENISNRSL